MSLDRQTQEAIWQVVNDIPAGKVLAYGEIAALAGYPRGARMVARALRAAPRSMALPWHRVINAQGKISFPSDSTYFRQQKERLESEGVVFVNGRVNLQQYGWKGVVDELIWGEQ